MSIKRKAIVDALAANVVYLINSVYFIVYFFVIDDTSTYFDFFLTPFTTLIPVNNLAMRYLCKGAFLIVGVFLMSGWLLPQVLNHPLAVIFARQFWLLDERFKQAIAEDGSFTGSIRTFRRRHLMLCKTVESADCFVSISNVAGFGCQMANVIMVMYSLIFFEYPDATTHFGVIFWFVINGLGLFFIHQMRIAA